jgi:flagellar protein FlaG
MTVANGINVNSTYQGQGSSTAAASTNKVEDVSVQEKVNKDVGRPLTGEDGKVASKEQVQKAVQEINKKANGVTAVFGVDDESSRVYIKIVDKESDKTIVQYPAEETLKLINKVWDQEGFTVDEKR